MKPARLPILSWHAAHIEDNSYAGNDLIAFSEDLQLLDREGWTILPLHQALGLLRRDRLPEKSVCLSADDAPLLDFHAFEHPSCGLQTSLFQRMQDFLRDQPRSDRHQLHLSVFAIASPEAREELDQTDYLGLGLWPDNWWQAANQSGLISVESHSWDHNHGSLKQTAQRDNRRGDFRWIDSESECRIEIDQASDYIEQRSGRRPQYFAYPYGQASDYLRKHYLPEHGARLGLQAALATEPEPVTRQSDTWHLPRYMCGRDWQSPEQLKQLLAEVD